MRRIARLPLVIALCLDLAGCSGVHYATLNPAGDPSGEYRVSRSDIADAAHDYIDRLMESDYGKRNVGWTYARVADFCKRYEDVEIRFLSDGTIVGTDNLPWDQNSRFGRWIRGAKCGLLLRDAEGRYITVSIATRGPSLRVMEYGGDCGGPHSMDNYFLVRVF